VTSVSSQRLSRNASPSPQKSAPAARASERLSAALIVAPGRIEIIESPLRDPAPSEVRIRMEGCGVCASNVPVWEGREWFQYPQEPGSPGHEGWGIIDAVGKDVRSVQPGDRVAALTYHAFASHDFAPEGNVLRLPEALSQCPVPGEPLGCAINIFRRAAVEPGESVAIVGIGFLGALLTQLTARRGARVIAIARRESALQLARACGATDTIPMLDHNGIIQQVMQLTGGEGCHCVIEAAGKQWPLDLAAELTRVRGRLIVAGYHQDGPRQVNMQLWNWRGLDVINAHERAHEVYVDGMSGAIKALLESTLDPSPLYTHNFGLHQLDQALAVTATRPEGFCKALVRMGHA
jgi:NADPH:quinone reductase